MKPFGTTTDLSLTKTSKWPSGTAAVVKWRRCLTALVEVAPFAVVVTNNDFLFRVEFVFCCENHHVVASVGPHIGNFCR